MYRFDAAISSTVETGDLPAPGHHATMKAPSPRSLVDRMHRYWQAANYLTAAQIYLRDNPLLAGRSGRSTSSRACSATGARRPG